MGIYCVGVLPDLHIPFHSRKALAAALNCLADSNIKSLYLLGDVVDFYNLSSHGPKHPGVIKDLQDEISETNKFLDTLDKTWPSIPKHFIEGNHEFRLERYIANVAPALFGINGISETRTILKLNLRPNWKYYPYGPRQIVKMRDIDLFVKHAPKGSSGAAILNAAGCNMIFGHIHRAIYERKVTADGRQIRCVSPGWLGDIRFDKVFGYVAGHHNWQQGFSRIWINSDTREFSIENIEIINDKYCMVNGKKYSG